MTAPAVIVLSRIDLNDIAGRDALNQDWVLEGTRPSPCAVTKSRPVSCNTMAIARVSWCLRPLADRDRPDRSSIVL